jgi:hypothetical protein
MLHVEHVMLYTCSDQEKLRGKNRKKPASFSIKMNFATETSLGKRWCWATASMPSRDRSSPNPLARHAWDDGLEELAVNRVEDERHHGRTPLLIGKDDRTGRFQDDFAEWWKRFRQARAGAPIGTNSRTKEASVASVPKARPPVSGALSGA